MDAKRGIDTITLTGHGKTVTATPDQMEAALKLMDRRHKAESDAREAAGVPHGLPHLMMPPPEVVPITYDDPAPTGQVQAAPQPVIDTIAYKWFCECGGEAVGRMTPQEFDEFKELWRTRHVGWPHRPCTATEAREAREARGRPSYQMQLGLEQPR
jgi:hypothetical protein